MRREKYIVCQGRADSGDGAADSNGCLADGDEVFEGDWDGGFDLGVAVEVCEEVYAYVVDAGRRPVGEGGRAVRIV